MFLLAGTTAYDTVRPLAYQDAKIFMICFNIAEPETLNNSAAKVRDIGHHTQDQFRLLAAACKFGCLLQFHVIITSFFPSCLFKILGCKCVYGAYFKRVFRGY